MSELVALLDGIIAWDARRCLVDQIREKEQEAKQTDAKRCGNCYLWMKSIQCPREVNVNGLNRGPSMNDFGCGKFVINPWVADLKVQRLAEVEALKTSLDAPVKQEEGS